MDKQKNIDESKLPKHVGLILDGNRRWAKNRNFNKNMGHLEGFRTLKKRLFDFFDAGIRYLSIYALSLENMRKRSKKELKYIYRLIIKAIEIVMEEYIVRDEKIKFKVIGRLSLLPQEVQDKIQELHDYTKDFNRAFLNICIMYDGQEEIVDAVKKIVQQGVKPEEINKDLIKSNLYTNGFPEVDFIIRTGMDDGARISGFLLWDASYAEFKFRNELWPDYSIDMLEEDLKDYAQRNRRKGV